MSQNCCVAEGRRQSTARSGGLENGPIEHATGGSREEFRGRVVRALSNLRFPIFSVPKQAEGQRGARSMHRRVLILLCLSAAGGAGALRPVTAQVPPDESWQSLETSHFRVTFPKGMDPLARRAAARAERAFEALSEVFLDPPGGLIQLLLTDHTETSNGFATAVPYNRIIVFVRPPMDGGSLSHFDDWMELVITHELVHVFQLDHAGSLGSLIRSVLGRWEAGWPTFSGFDLPSWTTEGVATYYESSLTTSGRVRGSYVDMVLRTAVLEDGLERLDQVTGSSPNWPAGDRVYVYGATFFDHLSDTYGEERLGAFADAIARQWIPYRVNAGAKHAFGVSFSKLWGALANGSGGPVSGLSRFTGHGRSTYRRGASRRRGATGSLPFCLARRNTVGVRALGRTNRHPDACE